MALVGEDVLKAIKDAQAMRASAMASSTNTATTPALNSSGGGLLTGGVKVNGAGIPKTPDTATGAPTGAIASPTATINNQGGTTTTNGDQRQVGVDPTGNAAAEARHASGLDTDTRTPHPDTSTPQGGGWDSQAAAQWDAISKSFDTALGARQQAIGAQTSGLERRNIEMNALRGGNGIGGAAQAGAAQAVLSGAQMQSEAVADNEKNKLGAKMAYLGMLMDRAKADQNLEAQKQIQAMIDETTLGNTLAQGGGLDYTQIQRQLNPNGSF